jgi:hypothetical protein
MALGWPVQLVSDGHSTLDKGLLTAAQISQHHNITLSNIESFGPRTTLVTAKDLRFEDCGAPLRWRGRRFIRVAALLRGQVFSSPCE